ncbi:MAG: 50S ribosomal protein L9 [Clostridia bacterium]|nr:50S ribosomal protein L9 [Clostridia bacterium]
MKVVLTQDVKDLGKKGELVNVADGYGKNFLIPRKLAVIADNAAMSELKNRETAKQYHIAMDKKKATEEAAVLEGKTLRISASAGQNGKLFGSVTTKEIAEKIMQQFSVEVDKKKITCDDIRSYGQYTCTVKLYQGITATLYVVVGE